MLKDKINYKLVNIAIIALIIFLIYHVTTKTTVIIKVETIIERTNFL